MKQISWNNEKNAKLKSERGIGFEDALFPINSGEVLDIVDIPNKRKYPYQRVFIQEYAANTLRKDKRVNIRMSERVKGITEKSS